MFLVRWFENRMTDYESDQRRWAMYFFVIPGAASPNEPTAAGAMPVVMTEQTDRRTDRLADRETNVQTDRQTDRYT